MTLINKKIIISVIIFLASLAGLIFLVAPVQASNADNVFGQAWGASDGNGMGWLSMNNCSAPNNCSGVNYGVTIDYTNPASSQFSGAAWSSNYGWVNFNSNSCGAAPSVDLESIAQGATSAPVTGWIHVHNAIDDGFWDGCISMSGTTTNGDPYGVVFNDNGSMSGAAWGAEVVGWVDFSQVTADIQFGCTDSSDTVNYNPDADIDDGSCSNPSPNPYCTNSPWSTPQGQNLTLDTEADFDNYNNGLAVGEPMMLYNGGICVEEKDECPSNLDGSAPWAYWNGVQTQADIDDYNDNNGPNDPDIIMVSGYCQLQGTIIVNPPQSGEVTIPIFEEI